MIDQNAFYAEVGNRIRREREARGLTQHALGSLVSLTRVSVTNIEMGRQKLLLHTIVDFAIALQVHPCDLIPASAPALDDELNYLLKDKQQDEQEWVLSTVKSTKQKRGVRKR